jgi:hypothetical protein
MNKNAQIQIGGEMMVDLIVVNREDNPSRIPTTGATEVGGDRDFRSTIFNNGDDTLYDGAHLDFKINAGTNSYVFIELDLSEFTGAGTNNQNLINKAYFAWEDLYCSKLDIYFGKRDVNFGMNKYTGITSSYHDGGADWLTNTYDGGTSLGSYNGGFATAPTEVYSIGLAYHATDWLDLSFDLFQNTTAYEDGRSADDLFFQSWAAKAEINPTERLMLQFSVLNQHNDVMGDRALTAGGDPIEDQWALSMGIDYTMCKLPINLWLEYTYAFDWGYDAEAHMGILGGGITYTPNSKWSFTGMVEYAGVDDMDPTNAAFTASPGTGFTVGTGPEDERYMQVILNTTYTLDSGMYITAEVAKQWYENDRPATAGFVGAFANDATMIGLRTGINF